MKIINNYPILVYIKMRMILLYLLY